MKQHITPEQLLELTAEQKDKLREWWNPEPGDVGFDNSRWENFGSKEFYIPLLSIGRMIELLGCPDIQKRDDEIIIRYDGGQAYGNELVDALWQAVKEVL